MERVRVILLVLFIFCYLRGVVQDSSPPFVPVDGVWVYNEYFEETGYIPVNMDVIVKADVNDWESKDQLNPLPYYCYFQDFCNFPIKIASHIINSAWKVSQIKFSFFKVSPIEVKMKLLEELSSKGVYFQFQPTFPCCIEANIRLSRVCWVWIKISP